MNLTPHSSDVSVLGLGTMGAAIAAWLMKQGMSATVWNRTPGKAEELLKRGAVWADSPTTALDASPLAFAIVDSYETIGAWVRTCRSLEGKTLVNITTGAPSDAPVLESAVLDKGGHYIDAALFCYPDAVGNQDSAARFSGSLKAWMQHRCVLESIGGDAQYLGDRVELANVVDGAWISFYVPALIAALEAAAFAASHDVPFDMARQVISTALPVIDSFLAQSAELMRAGDLESENPVRLYEQALRTVIVPAEEHGLPAAMPRAAMQVMNGLSSGDRDVMDLAVLVRRLLEKAHGMPG